MDNKHCCEYCISNNHPFCTNNMCQCHVTLCSHSFRNKSDDWRDEFDKEFSFTTTHPTSKFLIEVLVPKLKSFIAQKIAEAREEERERIIAKLKEMCNSSKTEKGLIRALTNFIQR